MRTTITLDDDVAARLTEIQHRQEQTFKDVVNEMLRRGLEQAEMRSKPARPFRVKARAMGARPGLNYDNIGDLLEQLEGAAHQ